MRLSEIVNFEPVQGKNIQKSKVKSYIDKNKINTTGEEGMYARAYDFNSPKRLNQVTKVARAGKWDKPYADNITDDAYLTYLKTIQDLEKSGHNNPYFPKIHDLRIVRDENGKLSYHVNMEKLVNINSPKILNNRKLIKSVGDKLVKDPIRLNDTDYVEHDYAENPDVEDSKEYLKHVIETLDVAIENNNYSDIKDENLINALKVINKIKSTYSFLPDIHPGNVMWRITGTMPQLVITDPLA